MRSLRRRLCRCLSLIRGIYIHIPFCRHKCNYCDFNSRVSEEYEIACYIDALCGEIEAFEACEIDTVYFGGGTPTMLKAEQIIRVLETVKKHFWITNDCEISIECNPATMGEEGFLKLRNAGFNRLSVGMQSADNEQLKILGRIHSFEDTKKCIEDAKKAGFDNISVDLMFGLPNQDKESFIQSVSAAIALNTNHISCYALKIEEGTPFYDMDLKIADDDQSFEMYEECVKLLKENGFTRYEISNFAKEGYESRHNKKYWLCNDFAGFGAGAYSCINGVRYSNITDVQKYIEATDKTAEKIRVSKEDMMSEFVFLGLRLGDGISVTEFSDRFSEDIFDVFKDAINKNLARGTLVRERDRIKIPEKYMYVSNSIMVDFV